MQYDVNFGTLSGKPRAAAPGTKIRLALLGDFSGRANAGQLETGESSPAASRSRSMSTRSTT
ncbi:MAG TPA: hypothetical protein VGH36_05810 [Acetobacteraceae bacterium]|jgi:hypothetical protein